MPWYVIYTKSKSEIKTAEFLEKMGIEVYCPVTQEIRQWSDRKKKITVPLFKSYVFVKLSEKERPVVFDAPGVVRYLFWLGKPAIVRQYEIDVIKQWMEDDAIQNIKISHLKPGDNMIIDKGSFKGKKAIIKEIGKKRIRLMLPKLGVYMEARINEVFSS